MKRRRLRLPSPTNPVRRLLTRPLACGRPTLRALALLLPALLLAPPTAAADVLLVDAGGQGDFLALKDAVQAAASGDTILVASSQVPPLESVMSDIDGKSLVIAGLGTPAPDGGRLWVRNLPAGGQVVVRNLEFGGTTLNSITEAVRLEDNAGAVWLEDVEGTGAQTSTLFFGTVGAAGLWVGDCAAVTIVGSTFRGGSGVDEVFVSPSVLPPTAGGPGLSVAGSTLAVARSRFFGGEGGAGDTLCGASGGEGGLATSSAQVFASKSIFKGGDDGSSCAGTGIAGWRQLGASAAVWHLESTFLSGGPLPGDPFQVLGGGFTALPGPARTLSLSAAPLFSFDAGEILYQGEMGDTLGLFLSPAALSLPLPAKHGAWSLGSPLLGPFVVGPVTDPGGALGLPFGVPDVGLAAPALTTPLQALVLDDLGGLRLSTPTALILVDELP